MRVEDLAGIAICGNIMTIWRTWSEVHKDLIQELRLASADESMSLDKSEFSFDLLDSFRLALEFVKC